MIIRVREDGDGFAVTGEAVGRPTLRYHTKSLEEAFAIQACGEIPKEAVEDGAQH